MAELMVIDCNTCVEVRSATTEELAASLEAAKRDGGKGVVHIDGRECIVVEK